MFKWKFVALDKFGNNYAITEQVSSQFLNNSNNVWLKNKTKSSVHLRMLFISNDYEFMYSWKTVEINQNIQLIPPIYLKIVAMFPTIKKSLSSSTSGESPIRKQRNKDPKIIINKSRLFE